MSADHIARAEIEELKKRLDRLEGKKTAVPQTPSFTEVKKEDNDESS